MRAIHSTRFVVVVVGLGLVLAPNAWGEVPDFDLRIPSAESRRIVPGSAPSRVRAFWDRYGADTVVFWDDILGTPRYVSMRKRTYLSGPGGGTVKQPTAEMLASGAREFFRVNGEFYGTTDEHLDGPEITRIGTNYVLAFSQAVQGVPLRGGSASVVCHEDGQIAFVTSFLLRNPPADAPQSFLTEELARLHAREQYQLALTRIEWQAAFSTLSTTSLRGAWCAAGEKPDGAIVEVFFDGDGKHVAEVPLVAGFGPCVMPENAFTANGSIDGNSPHPRDIYATAAIASGRYNVPGAFVRSSEGKAQLADLNGDFTMTTARDSGIFYSELSLGRCVEQADGLSVPDRVFSVRRTLNDCESGVAVVRGDDIVQSVANSISFTFNLADDPIESFELLTYHNVQHFHTQSLLTMAESKVSAEWFFPLEVVVPTARQEFAFPSPKAAPRAIQGGFYSPTGSGSRICISRRFDNDIWFPATIVQHEYAHHLVHTLVKTNERPMMLEGVADALTALHNRNPRIGYLSDNDAGPLGFRLEQSIPALEAHGLSCSRAALGTAFWTMRDTFKNGDEAERLLYRWLASHHAKGLGDRKFEFSPVILEHLLDVDDLPGEGAFQKADGNRANGTPHEEQIVPALAAWSVLTRFLRGDGNGSGAVDLSDAIVTLDHLFLGGDEPVCLTAADVNGTGDVDVTDPIYTLAYLFTGGNRPASPFPNCGACEESELPCIHGGCAAE